MTEPNQTSFFSKFKKLVLPLFVIATAVTLFGTLYPFSYELPSTIWKQDKFWHFAAFLVWTILFGGVLAIKQKKRPKLFAILLYSATFGLLIEVLQFVLPIKRSPEVLDFVADFLGSMAALALLSFIFKRIFDNNSDSSQ